MRVPSAFFTITLLAGAAAGLLAGCSGDDDDSTGPTDASVDGSHLPDSSVNPDASDAATDGGADADDAGDASDASDATTCPDGGRYDDGGFVPGCSIDLGSLVTSTTTKLELTTRDLFTDGGLVDAGDAGDGGSCTRAYEDYVFDITGQTVTRASCVAVDGGFELVTGTVSLTSAESGSLLTACTNIHEEAPPGGEDAVCDGDPTTLPADYVRTDATGNTVIAGCPSPASAVWVDDAPAFTQLRALFASDAGDGGQ